MASKTPRDSVLGWDASLNGLLTAMARLTSTFLVLGLLLCLAMPLPASAFPTEVSEAERNAIRMKFESEVQTVGSQVSGGPAAPSVPISRSWVRLPKCDSTVATDGGGNFRTIQAAIDAVPRGRGQTRWVICVSKGTYKEKVKVPITASYVSLWGAPLDATQVTIQWGDTAATPVPGGTPGQKLGSYDSYTFAIEAEHFSALYITFQNTAARPKDGDPNGQAVAVRTSNNYQAFYKCQFRGHQDTLFAHQGLQYYRDCYLRGSVDFIFGNATALFQNCDVYADVIDKGFLTAQARATAAENTGFVFRGGSVTGTGLVYLGRAWGLAAKVVFLEVYLGPVVKPEGWDRWGKPTNAIFYGEYSCSGPGSARAGRVGWAFQLTAAQARPFLSPNFIQASTWLPTSGLPAQAVPY
ncbi:hypothetical protein CBR_g1086 [Chara braunii]|uniref:pectinesterase n=1 Tax=Chara braunii TaxID=69332 RepID=A0A388KD72_CHABU|nr:hypothetical protein CBR_g1086 [Chara braunii]|eukprot:GBG67967.1 hypothetical protein CBR_g1086 [Chara braunii]